MNMFRLSLTDRWKLLLMIAVLYFVQGLPLGLAFHAYPVLLRRAGTSLDLIALIPFATLPWVMKIFLAPWVENHWIPGLGRRKSWILPMSAVMAAIFCIIALVPFTADDAPILLGLLGLSSLSGAVQDIATDGAAAERLQGRDVAHVNALQVACFMLGLLVGGAGVMVGTDTIGQTSTMMILAVTILLCGILVLRWREPPPPHKAVAQSATLPNFFRRDHSVRMLFLSSISTWGGAMVFALAKLVLVDAGWSLAAVGTLSGAGNSVMVVLGCALATLLLKRTNAWNVLVVGLLVDGCAGGAWAVIALAPKDMAAGWMWFAAALGGGGIGVVTTTSYTLLMRYSQIGVQPATDLSMFRGVGNLGEIVMSSVATLIAARIGYSDALMLGSVVALAAVLLVLLCRKVAAFSELASPQ